MADDVSNERIAVAFRLLFAADARAGEPPALAHYLARFPGFDAVIAAEYLLLCGKDSAQPATPATDRSAPVGAPPPMVIGPYRLLHELGRGGQAVVWVAEDTRLKRRVALKVMTSLAGVDPGALARFRREAEAASRVEHPGVCTVYETGIDGGIPWIAMRLVAGETLARRFAAGRPSDRAAMTTLVQTVASIARALHAAHELGVLHRDVKPANVVVTPDGSPVLLDFGLAHLDATSGPNLTLTGDVFGTPAYMSPEQIDGAPVDRRTDIWSLGVVLYEGLTGERPFAAATRERLHLAIRQDEPRPIRELRRDVPRELAVIIATCLEKDRDRRYGTAEALAQDLLAWVDGRPIAARPVGPIARAMRWIARRPAIAATGIGFTVLAATALTITLSLLADTRAERDLKNEALADVERLAELHTLKQLTTWDQQLWPTTQEHAAGPNGMDGWIAAAERILAARDRNQPLLRALEERLGPAAGPRAPGLVVAADRATERDLWLRDGLAELSRGADALAEPLRAMHRRREFARDVVRRTVEEPRDLWAEAIAQARVAPYDPPVALRPIVGLVPLGPDPESHLLEFWQPEGGPCPTRDPRTGRWHLAPDSGFIFVLVPGGTFNFGAGIDEPGELYLRNEIFRPLPGHGGIARTVAPFLAGKFEVTQGQWLRIMGINPAYYAAGRDDPTRTLANPVESITWIDAGEFARRVGARLPQEVEWEWAARARSTTPWHTGDAIATLNERANIGDEGSQAHWPPGYPLTAGVHDGYWTHAPVGSFPPNPFGLHDVIGNVAEFLSEMHEAAHWTLVLPTDTRPLSERTVLSAGGSFADHANRCRSASRTMHTLDLKLAGVGLRLARDLP